MGEIPARVYVQDLFDKNHEYVGFSHCFTCARKAKEELEARIRELEARLRDYEARYGELGREGA